MLRYLPGHGHIFVPVNLSGSLHNYEEGHNREHRDRESGIALQKERVRKQHQIHELRYAGFQQCEFKPDYQTYI